MSEPTPIPENAPWWAKGIISVGHAFGISAIILGFYLGQSAGVIPNPVEDELIEVRKELQELKGVVVQQGASTKAIVEALEEQGRERQMRCVLRAKTEEEKRQCFPKRLDP